MSASKAAKVIAFTAHANDHHNGVKIKSILKWLKSGHEVRVKISGKADRHRAMEEIYNSIESDVKSGAKFLQKQVKPDMIKVNLIPTKEAADLEITGATKTNVTADDDEISEIMAEKDVFSGEFEEKLNQSIRNDWARNKKK